MRIHQTREMSRRQSNELGNGIDVTLSGFHHLSIEQDGLGSGLVERRGLAMAELVAHDQQPHEHEHQVGIRVRHLLDRLSRGRLAITFERIAAGTLP